MRAERYYNAVDRIFYDAIKFYFGKMLKIASFDSLKAWAYESRITCIYQT